MTTWLDALNQAWRDLAGVTPIAKEFRTKLISRDIPLDVLAGVRARDGAPCLLLQIKPSPDTLFELGGMRLSTAVDDSGVFLVLSLEDSDRRDLFATICADVINASAEIAGTEALNHFLARLNAWRQFLKERRAGLSKSETVGLLGELIMLEYFLAATPRAYATWKAPDDGLHDFELAGHAIEVKTGLGPTSSLMISALDQLDYTGLRRLHLVHVRLIEAPGGRNLQDLTSAVSKCLSNDGLRRHFENSLLRRGLMPDDDAAKRTPRVAVRAIDGYAITDSFPRLIRANVFPAILDATYVIDLRAIAHCSVATQSLIAEFLQLET